LRIKQARSCFDLFVILLLVCIVRLCWVYEDLSAFGSVHSQTFANKSSPPPKAFPWLFDAGAGCGGAAPGVTGAALLQPPKSSSWVTVGCCVEVEPVLLPQPPKSSDIDVVAGVLYDVVEAAV